MKRISVVGLGYIGLPTAAMFASHGIKVLGVDINEETCEIINGGGVHIQEPFLSDIIKTQVANSMIVCSQKVKPADAFLIAVPTPVTDEKTADLSYVIEAGRSISRVLKQGDLVVLESTVPPRCTIDILLPVLEESGLKAGEDFYLAHCPERVLPGQVIHEIKHNNRVIGGINQKSAEKALALYSAFVKAEMFVTDTITAELCKLMENTYRDVNIALANELAKICEHLETNVWDVIRYANKHPRVNLHSPGPGVGGHCLAIDPWFVIKSAPDLATIIELARNTNDSMPKFVAQKIKKLVTKNSKITILGCTYKPDVGDLRESPIMDLLELIKDDFQVNIVDPFIDKYDFDVYEASKDASLVILGVNHKSFENINFAKLKQVVKEPVILDTRNYFNKDKVKKMGFAYHLLGYSCKAEHSVHRNIKEIAATKNQN